jgi:hypothetical protein
MTFEGFEAAMLIEVQQGPLLLLPTDSTGGPTLQDALSERGLTALRPLSPDEMLLIAGGNGSEFTVMGPGPEHDPWDDPWYPGLPSDSGPSGGGGGGGGGGGSETPSGGNEGETPGGAFDDRVTIDPSVPADQLERAHQAELQLQTQMSELDAKIQSLPDNALVTIDDKTYTGAELKELWAQLSVVITWTDNFGPIGSAMNFNGLIKINLADLEMRLRNTGSPTEWGVDDFLIHELSHMLPADVEHWQAQRQLYRDSGGSENRDIWQQSSYFQDAESYTHSWGRVIGATIGLPGYAPQLPPDNDEDDSDIPMPL